MWYDNWSEMGPLIQYITYRDIYDARLPLNIKVSDIMQNGKWKWPQDWYDKFPLITSIEDPTIQNDYNDIVVWISKNEEKVRFSVKTATIDLGTEVPRVRWWRLIWYAQCIPKHSFIFCLAIQNRLSTQDRMAKWGLYTVNRCPLCQNDNEDLQHLFFKCKFSSEVWSKAKEMAEINCEKSNWQELIRRLANDCVNKNIGWVVKRLILAACIYYIWLERNGRIIKDVHNSSQEVYN
ncbi:reverse transcriptase zinc-binding domain-containing protein [Artemisia annua]|uniref:Reverse transcriptase zinc-binding domain-containing protein n=1 Tax=Artemisia annua TaxID=35608 RepID=A0A2U1KX73_ARTAN|nr:reverse transcriptase zinc-binding domain-containing protein [Artemisia annua]